MCALFADLPEALENTVEIARRCAFKVAKRKPILPKFADDEVEELRRQARAGLAAPVGDHHAVCPLKSTKSGWNSNLASSSRWASPAIS